MQEAIYHGVPILGLPFGTDQKLNMNRIVRDGFGIKMDWHLLNEDALYEALTSLLIEPR